MTESLGDNMARLQVDISEELKTRLKLQAVREDVNMSDVVEKALKLYLDQLDKQNK